MPRYHYDTPKLSPRVKACRDQQNEYRYRNSTAAAAARQVCENTTAYGMETSSADVTATAPDAEALTVELLVCAEPECENQPCFAEPGQTTALPHPLLPPWSVAAKTCNRFYLTRYYHTQQDSFETTAIPPHVITPLRYPPGVVNNLKSQPPTLSPGVRCIPHPHGIPPRGDKIPKPKMLSSGVWYTLSYTVVRPHGRASKVTSSTEGRAQTPSDTCVSRKRSRRHLPKAKMIVVCADTLPLLNRLRIRMIPGNVISCLLYGTYIDTIS